MDVVELLDEIQYPRNTRPPQAVDPLIPTRRANQDAGVEQSRKVLRRGRLLQARGLGYLADRRRAMGQMFQDPQPGGVAQRCKHSCPKAPLFGCHPSVSRVTVHRNITIL